MKIKFVQHAIDEMRGKNKRKGRLNYNQVRKDFYIIKAACEHYNRGFQIEWSDRLLMLKEATPKTNFDSHYVYHPALALRSILKYNPKKHVDIASTLNFVTMLSAFLPVEFYDYRPASLKLDGLDCGFADLTKLPFADNSVESISCMHVVEHVGLGRYGDELDANGDLKAMQELNRVVAKNGHLIFVVPVGAPKIEFNAHRIYSYEQIMDNFKNLSLVESWLIPDDAVEVGVIFNPDSAEVNNNKMGCSVFVFNKI